MERITDSAEKRTTDPKVRALLRAIRESGHPAYLEVDPATSALVLVAPVRSVQVGRITEATDAVEVELIISSARHWLRRDNEDFAELLAALRQAQTTGARVLVAETDQHWIIDVRPDPAPQPPEERVAVTEVPPTGTAVTLARATEMFELVNRKTCCSASPGNTGIPFTYPDDFCQVRAHEMYRLMSAEGVVPDKIWIYGNLSAETDNSPNHCAVTWNWHVAPCLQVNGETYVLDPALFRSPVPKETWVAACRDPSAKVVVTTGRFYYRTAEGGTVNDDTFTRTATDLGSARTVLQRRVTYEVGLPPYQFCAETRPRPIGVATTGTLPPNGTTVYQQRRSPESLHILWSVVPRSICAKSALTWSVAVCRNDAPSCDYWVTVTNTSDREVHYEIRSFMQA